MKPMLAVAVGKLEDLSLPMMLSPKLDGVRAMIVDGVVMSRSMKPIPNSYVQTCFGHEELNGLDGELIVGDPYGNDVFNRTSSGVMSRLGLPEVKFWVFDDFSVNKGFRDRYASASLRCFKKFRSFLCKVPHYHVDTVNEINEFEEMYVSQGHEGVMLRSLDGPYKQGRSTLKEGYLLKLKRFEDGEAIVIGMTELMHNSNEAVVNELGQKERSSKKDGMIGKGTMGSLLVRDLKTNVEFEIGTGFDAGTRAWWWKHRAKWLGTCQPNPPEIVKYKYQTVGVKDKPRFPVYMGRRDRRDMS